MRLRVVSEAGSGTEYPVPATGGAVLGRDPGCDVELSDRRASRHHCRLELIDGQWWIEDLDSANGTWLDGRRARRARLRDGALIRIGDTIIEVLAAGDRAVSGGGPTARRRALLASLIAAGALLVAGGGWLLLAPRGSPEDPGYPALTGPSGAVVAREAGPRGPSRRPEASASASGREEKPDRAGGDPQSTSGSGSASRSGSGSASGSASDSVAGSDSVSGSDSGSGSQSASGSESGSASGSESAARPPGGPSGSKASRQIREARGLLAAHRYREARGLAEEEAAREQRAGQTGERAAALVREAQRAALEEIGRWEREADDRVARGGYGPSREEILDLAGRLPEDLVERASKLLARLGQREEKRRREEAERATRGEEMLQAMRVALARLDVDEAARRLEKARGVIGEGASRKARSDLDSVGRAIEVLERGVASLAERGGARRWRWRPGRGLFRRGEAERLIEVRRATEGPSPLELVPAAGASARAGRRLRLRLREPGDGSIWSADLFSLVDEDLLSVLDAGFADADHDDATRRVARRGLARLLWLREGRRRAAGFIEAAFPEGEEAIDFPEESGTEPFWLRARAPRALAEAAEADESPEKATARLEEIADLVSLLAREAPDSFRRRELEGAWTRARTATLRRELPASLSPAGRATRSGETVEIRFDFREGAQAAAFAPIDEASRVEVGGGQLRVSGGCRFLEEGPFRGRLRVKLELARAARSDAAGGVLVALWTRKLHPVAPAGPISLTRSLVRDESWQGEYVVFAAGVRGVITEYGGTRLEEVRPCGSEKAVELPADAIFVERAEQRINTLPCECIWAAPGRRSSAPRRIEVDYRDRFFRWKVDGRAVGPKDVRVLERLPPEGEARGSVTLLAISEPFALESLEIEGALDEEWVEEELGRRAEAELYALTGRRGC